MHNSGEGEGVLLWNKDGNQGHTWLEASVPALHGNAFWVINLSSSTHITQFIPNLSIISPGTFSVWFHFEKCT